MQYPIGDDIEPVGESRVGVGTGTQEEESLEVGIPTFEMIQKNPTSREERELEDGGHSVHENWRGAYVKDRRMRKRLQFEPLEKEGRKRTGPSWVSFDCVTQENGSADTTLEYENEPSPEVFQEAKIHSCAEVFVRIKDDSPLLNWISPFRNAILEQNENLL